MKIWKQTVFSLALAGAALLGWAYFYPGAGDVLSRYGIDWFQVASTGPQPAGGAPGAGRPPGGGPPGGGARRGGFSREASMIGGRP